MDIVAAVPAGCITNNHHEWAPFVVGETVVTVDHAWWAGLTEAARADISALGEVVSGPVDRPHPAQDSDRFWAVYRAHNRQYEHQRWHPGVAEWMAGRGDLLTLVVLDQFALEWLEAGGSPPVPTRLAGMLSAAMATHYPAFVKTSVSSGKNHHTMTECRDLHDVVDRLTRSPEHAKYYRRCLDAGLDGFLVFQRWNDEITQANTYRVLVAGGRVRGIAQQKWYKSISRAPGELKRVGVLVLQAWEELRSLLPFADTVLDLWVDNDSVVHLIECNPGGRWALSGSSLFHWVTLY